MSKGVRQTPAPSSSPAIEEKTTGEDSSAQDMMEVVLAKPSRLREAKSSEPARIHGVVIGQLERVRDDGQSIVSYLGAPSNETLTALSTQAITAEDASREVALSFIGGDPLQPVILGLIHKAEMQASTSQDQKLNVRLDDERLTLTADREIVLKCGKSSITLTRAGKVIIKGAYLSSHSSGVNRIKGGSVQLN